MSNNGDPNAVPVSRLVIEFAAPGSAEMSMHSENVSPAQMLAAAAWLDWWARRAFDQAAQKAPRPPGLIVPQIVIPPKH